MPKPSTPSLIGTDYTKPGRALPSQPRTPPTVRGALNTEAMTVNVTDARVTLAVTGLAPAPLNERGGWSQRSLPLNTLPKARV
jgi:hypothetical protein